MEAPRSSLLGKKYPVPILRTMWPFYTAGLIVAYGINSFATTLANSDEYRNDPRNPALKSGAKAPEKH
ncbi:atp18 subunit J of the mitochondrial F1F0 ATP synthase [Friedmanniomyces endolithicus]|uniref:Atp18 subunit J of the mitochondrial F1F0 ATP synthase n=1 Tax=Friedmanniomyces endolithicus TaxID=329885 RepID=A0AAN6HCR0_9PEZI|nr:atp18 subunit J of the mitochondrial F1F0 ATP synthase [Friedmanniomyces endolithicus]KAK0343288.1 atp18 subunit J of the mitochondrial F1F0 ATP synthase [Friedmanniomyces endolithicus]KAK0770501.1 atp18 subunit J of the mitochondrial F1F0 ATP synthase [Friedmanniomyces endolithicus]KAK0842881.1 atp18 subunit J of the mitochondrial F1F0 ATP synthase [Friedmanniomyces endolithicus]KAK0866272.1 atp18 subunit J of the mitochondrial F1F0 ATP synthase [Friedmanniomyces endolithicus]